MSESELETESPTLPLPPPIDLGNFIETVTRSVTRALAAERLNPQPLPPGHDEAFVAVNSLAGIRRPGIICGIWFDPEVLAAGER